MYVTDQSDFKVLLEGNKISPRPQAAMAEDTRYPVLDKHHYAENWFNTWLFKCFCATSLPEQI
jgi:hypothetical protein